MRHGPRSSASDHGAGLEPTLRRLARELAAAQDMALGLQVTVAGLIAGRGEAPFDALSRLQDLDRLAQTLGDLSTFTDAVAGATPEGWKVDARAAAGTLNLRDLAARLAASPTAADPDSEDDFLLQATSGPPGASTRSRRPRR
jgi:hypothetical protein